MENKNVGYMLLGISVLIAIIVMMFNSAMNSFVDSSCTLAHGGNYCPMYDTITQQTYLSLSIVGILVLVSLVLIISKPQEKLVIKTKTIEKKKQSKQIDTSSLTKEEKQVLDLIIQNKTIFQADLIEKTGFNKAKISRIIDRLEGKGIVERKRRGMTNIIVLKD
ncbi:MAG: helix-turn-helix transcriptional regulator [Candidatus Pacearchaeota archaeon]